MDSSNENYIISTFPDDNPENKVTDFRDLISSGDFGLYIIASHGDADCLMIEPYCRNAQSAEVTTVSKHLAMLAWYQYTAEDLSDPDVMLADYDHDGIPLCGPNGQIEHWIDEFGNSQEPPLGFLPNSDDDAGDIVDSANDDDEDGFEDEDPINTVDDDGDSLIDEDLPGDMNGDCAPGYRGNPDNGEGDFSVQDGEFLLEDLRVKPATLGDPPYDYDFFSIFITKEFIANYGSYSPDALVFAGACSSFWMADAWMNPPMSVSSYIGHHLAIHSSNAESARRDFFYYLGNPNSGGVGWNLSVNEAYESIGPYYPDYYLGLTSKDRCSAQTVLYEGDIYVDQNPPPTPHGDPGTIANPYTSISQALSVASSSQTVHVAEGLYLPTSSIVIPPGVTLSGSGPDKTEIRGDFLDARYFTLFNFENPFSQTIKIQDFKISHAIVAVSLNWDTPANISCPVEIRNNLFENNDTAIRMNHADPPPEMYPGQFGLDAFAPFIYNNIFYNNSEDGINCVFTRARISQNTIANSGNFGIYVGVGEGIEFPLIDGNIITNCSSYGLYCYANSQYGGYAHPWVTRNTFYGNSTDFSCQGCYWSYLNDINVDPLNVIGPMNTDLGGAGNFYLSLSSPARQNSNASVTQDNFGRLTTSADQTPGIVGSQADRGYYYHIRCEDLPAFTPYPTQVPTHTPEPTATGPTPTFTSIFTPTPTAADTPNPSPTGAVLQIPFIDDFESGGSDWTADGLWHIPAPAYAFAHSGIHSYYYGIDPQQNYDSGSANAGNLVLAPIYVAGPSQCLTFYSWELTEAPGYSVDSRTVYASTDLGSTWEPIYQSTLNDGAGHNVTIPLTYSDQYVIFKFRFDTVDDLNNNFRGWYVDDVYVGSGPLPATSTIGMIILISLFSIAIVFITRK